MSLDIVVSQPRLATHVEINYGVMCLDYFCFEFRRFPGTYSMPLTTCAGGSGAVVSKQGDVLYFDQRPNSQIGVFLVPGQ